jgi:wyosine [tRNA(Phe)-imidazoG37] synthetase (radical SAM superfamily)
MVIDVVARHVQKLRERGERIDFLTFVPDGEPTLDADLGEEMDGLRAALGKADWVSLKVDAADESTWRKVNRPYASLGMSTILEGMIQFAAEGPRARPLVRRATSSKISCR